MAVILTSDGHYLGRRYISVIVTGLCIKLVLNVSMKTPYLFCNDCKAGKQIVCTLSQYSHLMLRNKDTKFYFTDLLIRKHSLEYHWRQIYLNSRIVAKTWHHMMVYVAVCILLFNINIYIYIYFRFHNIMMDDFLIDIYHLNIYVYINTYDTMIYL